MAACRTRSALPRSLLEGTADIGLELIDRAEIGAEGLEVGEGCLAVAPLCVEEIQQAHSTAASTCRAMASRTASNRAISAWVRTISPWFRSNTRSGMPKPKPRVLSGPIR